MLGGVLAAALSGCSLLPPTTPSPASSPTRVLLPGQVAAIALRAALDAAAATSLDAAHASVLAWALSVSDDHLMAVSLPPATARPTASPSATTSSPSPWEALRTAASAFGVQARSATTAHPLVWASMSAWAGTLAEHWADASFSLEPARALVAPAPQSPQEAVQAALDAASEAVFGLDTAAGASGLTPEETAALRSQRAAWLTLRDSLSEDAASASPRPTAGSPWYGVERVADPADARALVARLEGAALPVLGRALAHGPASAQQFLASQIEASTRAVVRWGGLMQRWPGLPLS